MLTPSNTSDKTIVEGIAGTKAQRTWLRRLGMAGFLFFLIKGLLWLAIPALIALGIWK